MTVGVIHLCEGCGQEVDPQVSDYVRATPQVRVVTIGPTIQHIDGTPVLFHAECYTGSLEYRRLD
jgi:hypothetical protein